MKVKDRQIKSNQETVKRTQIETWTTADGKTFEVTVKAETTGAEDWTTETTEWNIWITNKNNPFDRFHYTKKRNAGCRGDIDYIPAINEARQEWNKKREEEKEPGEPMMADDATPDTKLRDLIRKDDCQYDEIPENMTVGELREKMKAGTPYYEICPVDSVIREIHFIAIAAAHGIDYNEPYENWLKH